MKKLLLQIAFLMNLCVVVGQGRIGYLYSDELISVEMPGEIFAADTIKQFSYHASRYENDTFSIMRIELNEDSYKKLSLDTNEEIDDYYTGIIKGNAERAQNYGYKLSSKSKFAIGNKSAYKVLYTKDENLTMGFLFLILGKHIYTISCTNLVDFDEKKFEIFIYSVKIKFK